MHRSTAISITLWDIRKQADKVMDGILANCLQIKMTEVSEENVYLTYIYHVLNSPTNQQFVMVIYWDSLYTISLQNFPYHV